MRVRHITSRTSSVAWLRQLCLLAVLTALSACYGDKDATGDDSLQQVTAVGGIASEVYTLYQGDTLRLNPSVSFSPGADTTRYDYRWLIGRSELIGTRRQLEWQVRLPEGYSMASTIPGVFVAHDRATGLEFRQTFAFQVLSSYTPDYVCVYERADGRIEWISLQGEPRAFTRWFDNMIERMEPDRPLTGRYRGALYSTNELAVFTDQAPTFGQCISIRNADASENFLFNVGEYTGPVYGKMYHGAAPSLSISNANFGYGASKYFICNGTLHVFNGLDRRLPIFDEQTFVKSRDVVQAMSSKQFQRYKKCTFVRHADNSIGAYHVYNDVMEHLTLDGEPFRLDSLCGCFTEATGMGSNQAYNIYLIGRKDHQYNIYQFYVDYINRTVQPLQLVQVMPLDASFAQQVALWWGSFGETYAFYLLDHHIYRFDYYEMSDFPSAKKRLIATIDPKYEIVDVQPLIPGMGLRDEDDCTVALLYNPATHTSTLAFYDTTSGKLLAHYPDIIPGRAVYFSRCL